MASFDEFFDAEEKRVKQADAQRMVPGSPANDAGFDSFFDQQQGVQRRANLREAAATSPEQAGEAARLAKRYPAPEDVLLRNLRDVQIQAAVEDADQRLKTSPKLAQALGDKPFLYKQTADDVPVLASLEQFAAETWGSVKAGTYGADRGAAGLFRGGFEFAAPLLDVLENYPEVGGNPLRRIAEGFQLIAEADAASQKKVRPKTDGPIEGGFQSGIESFTQNAIALPAAFLNPSASLAMMTGFTGGNAYEDARAKGLPMSQALPYATSQAAIEYATEKLPLLKLIGDVKAGTPFLKTLATQAALEIPGEQVATVLQDLNEWAVLNPEKPFAEYVKERPNAALQTLVATVVGTGGNVTLTTAIEKAVNTVAKAGQQQDQAQQFSEALGKMLETAEKSKLRERNPEDFHDLMEKVVGEGEIYVDAEVLNQLPVEAQQALPPAVIQQVPAAIASGGSVAMSMADVLTLAPGTPLQDLLLKNARATPDAPSMADASQADEQAKEWTKTEGERVVNDAVAQQEAVASTEAVKQQVLEQLNTAGRFRPAVNEQYATFVAAFYSTMAGRAGVTPQELAAKYPLRVVSTVGNEGVLNQDAPIDEATGLPLNDDGTVTVYHHTSAENAAKIRETGEIRSAGEPDLYFTTTPETDTGYGDTAVPIRVKPERLTLDDEFPDGRQDYRVSAPGRKRRVRFKDDGSGVLYQGARDQTETPEFKRWFGDSKVVDAEGKPLVVYHGTSGDFDKFSLNRTSADGTVGRAFYLSPSPDYAAKFGEGAANGAEGPANVMPVFVSARRVLDMMRGDVTAADVAALKRAGALPDSFAVPDAGVLTHAQLYRFMVERVGTQAVGDAYKAAGWDAVRFSESFGGDVIAVFRPEQIKSAIGNRGTFDPSDPSILNQGARGTFSPSRLEIALGSDADLSTFCHEVGHFFLEVAADMASQPNAPADLQKDIATLMQWFGVPDVATWNGMSLDQQRPYHERFAESVEQYLMEGRAPSVELLPVFRRFRTWLTSVYKSVQNFLGNKDGPIQLSDEVRQVLDRMLASQEQIAQAEEVAGLVPDEEATQRAVEKLTARSLRDLKWTVGARSKVIKELQAEARSTRKTVEAEVRAEIEALPAMQAKVALDALQVNPDFSAATDDWKARRDETLAAAREDIKAKAVEAEGPELTGLKKGQFLAKNKREIENKAQAAIIEWEKANPRPVRAQNATEEDLAVVAASFGFDSTDAMLQAVDALGSKADLIKAMTDQRMLQEHGDLIDQQAIEQAANEAVHNQARARALASELRTQAEAMNQRQDTGKTTADGRRITVNAIVAAAKQFGANVVDGTLMKDLRSRAAQHTAAERRAASKWMEATKGGKTAEAIKAKQDQVLNNAAARAALEAAGRARKELDYLRKFDRQTVRKNLPPEYLEQIDQLLEGVDLKVSTTGKELERRKSLREWAQNQEDLGLPVNVPEELLDAANLKSWKEMTGAQFADLVDAVKNIEHLGRLKNKLLTLKDKRAFDKLAEEAADTIIQHGGKPKKVELEGRNRVVVLASGFAASHRKMASLVRQMMGGKDGGALWDALIRPMNEAGTHEAVMIEQATIRLQELYKPVLKLKGGLTGDKQFIPEIGASLSRGGRLAIALNWGNAQNRQRVMGGDNWTAEQVSAILSRLTPVEAQFVNDVWAYLDSYWPEIKAKQERVSGGVEKKVEAEPFTLTLANGSTVQMRGGYYPIKYDTERSTKAEAQEAAEVAKDMMRGAFTRATTRRGHTKARTEEVSRPVRKDLDVITQHVTQVVHDLAWHEWVIDANRLLSDKRIEGAIRAHYGPDALRTMKDDVAGIATADVKAQTAVDKIGLIARSQVSRATMALSFNTALLQPFGLTQSMVRIGTAHVLRGAAQWAGDSVRMESSLRKIGEKSDFMRLRSKTMNREISEITQRVNGRSKVMTVIDSGLFVLTTKMQLVADIPTWLGAYNKAISEGLDEDTSVARADQAVLDAQGGGQTKDLAEVQRKHPMLTQFYSYFSVTLNLMAERTGTTNFKNPKAVAGWLGDMALLVTIPAMLPSLLLLAFQGGDFPDDEEGWAKWIAKKHLSYLLGLGVGFREASGMVEGFDYTGPPVARPLVEAGRFAKQAAQGEVDEPAVMAFARFIGTVFGIPITQAMRSYRGWVAYEEGDAPPTSLLFGPPPKD